MAVAKPPMNTTYRSPNRGGYSSPHRPEAIVWHVTVGGAAGSLSWLCSPASNASSNYLIDRAGTIYELVPPTESAWANGAVNKPDMGNPVIAGWINAPVNPNARSISVEHERTQSANNKPGGFTEAQHRATVNLGAWLCQEFGIPATRTNIIRHAQLDSVNRQYCPGLAEDEMIAWIGEIAALVGSTAPPSNQTVPVPAPGTAASTLLPTGQSISVINWDGQAATIDGTAYVDVGLTCTNSKGEQYSRSLKNGTMGPWTRVN
jgi:hypothetical protein